MKPDLASVVNARMVCFSAFARSEFFQNNARELGVGTRAILCRHQTGRRQKTKTKTKQNKTKQTKKQKNKKTKKKQRNKAK